MSRRRVGESEDHKDSAAERTVPMFPEATSAPPPLTSSPLGTLTREQREQEIKNIQNAAIAKTAARAALEKLSDETGIDDERAAIQAEGNPVADLIKGPQESLGKGFFGATTSPLEVPKKEDPSITPGLANNDAGEEVTYTKGEEMYGKSGQFSTYRVGPFSITSKVRSGETRIAALRRLSEEMNTFFNEERERAKKAFLAHYPTAFT